MPTRHLKAGGEDREPKSHQRGVDWPDLPLHLRGQYVFKWWVRRLLLRHASHPETTEPAGYTHRLYRHGALGIEGREKLLMIKALHVHRGVRREGGDHREGGAGVAAHRGNRAVSPCDVGLTRHHNQLAIEPIKRAQPEVAVREQLCNGEVSLVPTVDERLHRGCLEHVVGRCVIGERSVVVLHGKVKRVDEFGVNGHGGMIPDIAGLCPVPLSGVPPGGDQCSSPGRACTKAPSI